jgi:hypothetical protein
LRLDGDGKFSLTRFNARDVPRYGILSQTWEADDHEVTFQDIIDGVGNSKPGYGKIRFCGDQAQKDGLEYFWVNNCCINKARALSFKRL